MQQAERALGCPVAGPAWASTWHDDTARTGCWWQTTVVTASNPSGKFKMTHRYNACSALPRDAVRGGSIYLPCCEQVHGHRSVESPAPGETQPATSLRHGPRCGWGCPTPSWGFQTADQCGSSLCVFVQEVEPLHAHGSAL